MFLNRTVAPTSPIVSLDDAKDHLRIDGNDDDAVVARLILEITSFLDGPDGHYGRALASQTWEAKMAPLTGRTAFYAPVLPLISLTSVTYYDRDNASQTLDFASDLQVLKEDDRALVFPIIGTNWPGMYARPDALTITATYGHAVIPEHVKSAALIMIANQYENREAPMMPEAAKNLLAVSRRGWIGA